MNEILNDIVFRIECGSKKGTGFLLNNKFALTAFHVVKECINNEILVYFNNNENPTKAKLHELTNEKFKKLDIALLCFEEELTFQKFLECVDRELRIGDNWVSRGFPAAKIETGTNLFGEANRINQILQNLQLEKIDIHLDFQLKFNSYAGLSGAPLIVDDKIVGIINIELLEIGQAKEIHALSLKYFKELIENIGFNVPTILANINNSQQDESGSELWSETIKSDFRSIQQKINDVCSDYSEIKTKKYFRDIVSGLTETKRYNERDIAAMKFRIFEQCQDELIAFVEQRETSTLSALEIEQLIESYTNKAEYIITERSKNYKYPLNNKDILRKIVLDLINDCYLSFDKRGIYE